MFNAFQYYLRLVAKEWSYTEMCNLIGHVDIWLYMDEIRIQSRAIIEV